MIYNPAEDSYLLSRNLRKYVKGKSFLDMGSGSGIQSKEAITCGAKTTLAVDINKEAIKKLKENHIPAISSDLFSKVSGMFDIIAFNPPYLPEDKAEDLESRLITTGGKHGDEITIRFLNQAITHLSPKGVILLIVSSLARQSKMESCLKKLNLVKKIIDKESLFMEKLELWELKKKAQ